MVRSSRRTGRGSWHPASGRSARRTVAIPLLLIALAAGPAAAQDPAWSLRGVAGSPQLGWTRVAADDQEAEAGFSYGIMLGYGLSERLSVHVDVFRSVLANGLDQADLALRYSFSAAAGRLRPFVEAGGGWRQWSWKEEGAELFWLDTYERSAPVVSGGAGLAFFAAPDVTFDFLARYSRGRFTAPENLTTDMVTGEPATGSTLQLRAGITWHPGGERVSEAEPRQELP